MPQLPVTVRLMQPNHGHYAGPVQSVKLTENTLLTKWYLENWGFASHQLDMFNPVPRVTHAIKKVQKIKWRRWKHGGGVAGSKGKMWKHSVRPGSQQLGHWSHCSAVHLYVHVAGDRILSDSAGRKAGPGTHLVLWGRCCLQ